MALLYRSAWPRVAIPVSIVALISFAVPSPAVADFAQSKGWFEARPPDQRIVIQASLVLTRLYNGLIDDQFGPGTFGGLEAFERSSGVVVPDGVLSDAEVQSLVGLASIVYNRLGFQMVTEPNTGVSLPVPLKLTPLRNKTNSGTEWESSDGLLSIDVAVLGTSSAPLASLFNGLIAKPFASVGYSALGPDFFVISGNDPTTSYYLRVSRIGGKDIELLIIWPGARDDNGGIVATLLSSFFQLPGRTSLAPPSQLGAGQDAAPRQVTSLGSGFFVASSGLLITNQHVVDGCGEVQVAGYGSGKVIISDTKRDLAAILLASTSKPFAIAVIEAQRPQLGQSVVAAGYPLSDLLANTIQISPGVVTGLSGLGGDTNEFTTSASLEPGNSGGPIIDLRGHVVGVAVSKLNATTMLQEKGTTGAGVNFAISNETLIDFLRPFEKRIIDDGATPEMSLQQAVSGAKDFTAQVICRPQLP